MKNHSLSLSIYPLLIAFSIGIMSISTATHAQDVPPAPTAQLESPANGTIVSGLGFLSGWKCNAGEITITVDDREPITVVTGISRIDTADNCDGATDNGFIMQTNWNWYEAGEHTAVAHDDGEEFARSTFTVGTTGEEFVRDAMGECTIDGFPASGETARFVWNESTQHLELLDVMASERKRMPQSE
jgi:uncharacterized cupin superfamily protein